MSVSNYKPLSWEEYPEPRVVQVRGKLVVEVSIPRAIRHLFGSGTGKTNNRRLTTGTTDPVTAQRKMWTLAHEIYKQFDQKQKEHLTKHHAVADNFAVDAIYGLATSFSYKNIPDLKPSTEYSQLVALKNSCDVYADMIMNSATIDETKVMAGFLETSPSAEELVAKFREAQAGSPFTIEQKGLAGRYRSLIVHTYWQDLLLLAARQQGLPEPRTEQFKGAETPLVVIDGAVQVDDPMMRRMTNQPVEPISRPARVVPAGVLTIGSIRNDYFAFVQTKHDKINTRRKWSRAVDRFVDLMGDIPLQEIKPVMAYTFAQKQCDNNPDVSNANIKDYHTGVSLMLKYCVRKGYIEVNTFQGVGMKEYGKTSQPWLPFTLQDLNNIFDYNWGEQERLLLSIVATTGMRLTEAGMLSWERFNDTEVEGVRYFSLIDTEDERVAIKNEGSARHVPLHPALLLPPKGTGRLFDYTVDDNGLCSSSAGHIINPVLEKLAPHKRKSAHSFRRTLKVMLRDVGVSREINNIYTGHGEGDVAGRSYGGASIQTRYDAISKLDVSWLK